VTLTDATVAGGTLTRTGASVETATGSCTLRDVNHSGLYQIPAGSTTHVTGSTLMNTGSVRVNYNAGSSSTVMVFDDSIALGGAGDISLQNDNNFAQLTTTGNLLTQGPDHLIHGRGSIHARMLNQGTIRADFAAHVLTADSILTNAGLIEATGSGTMSVSALPTNFADSTLTGGAWHATSATLRLLNMPIRTNAADILLDGSSAHIYRDAGSTAALSPFRLNDTAGHFTIRNSQSLTSAVLAGVFTNRGTMSVGAASAFTVGSSGAYAQTAGSTTLASGTMTAAGGFNFSGGTLSGVGTLTGNVVVTGSGPDSATVRPGASVGTLNITGTYAQDSRGIFITTLGGTGAGQSALLAAGGAATIGGTLVITIRPDYGPVEGDTIKILRAASRSGVFSTVIGSDLGDGITFTPVYTDTTVLIAVSGVETGVAVAPGSGMSGGEGSQPGGGGSAAGGASSLPGALRFSARSEGGGAATFMLALPDPAAVTITLFDARGRRLGLLRNAAEAAGVHDYAIGSGQVNGAALASGVYFARAEVRTASGTQVRTARAVLAR